MDFRFELENLEAALEVVEDGASRVVEFALGYELEAKTVVLMQVLLVNAESYKAGQLEDVFDLQFGIREKLIEDDYIQTCIDFSIISTRRFVPKDARDLVTKCIADAIGVVVKFDPPTYLTMETYHPNIPPKGLQKYNTITKILEGLGYQVQDQFRGTTGIDYWLYRYVGESLVQPEPPIADPV